MSTRLLIVDDDRAMCDWLVDELERRSFEVSVCNSGEQALSRVTAQDFDVLLTDLNMPGISGIDVCRRLANCRPDVPVVVITAFGSLETAVDAIRAGAYDFITKPIDVEPLVIAVERAARHRSLREEVKRLRRAVGKPSDFEDLLGSSAPMRSLRELLVRVADADTTTLITGESGTGKELVAKALHSRSKRSAGPFVAVNCSAIPEALLESELFGHARGAFTDAKASRQGLFIAAHQGTLFLDEIGELPQVVQAKLLRALQERKVRPVGGDAELAFDARVIAATNRDLEAAIEEGNFREDLYYRINVIHVPLPPLRARGSDILLLAQHFLTEVAQRLEKAVSGISAQAAELLVAYAWPGNVRELENCMERAVALTRFDQITVEDLPGKIRDYRPSHIVVASDDLSDLVTLDEVERRYVLRVLEAAGGNKSEAARILGLDRKRLYRMLERWGTTSRGRGAPATSTAGTAMSSSGKPAEEST
jgi:DNA-binding NtrC family response regulator